MHNLIQNKPCILENTETIISCITIYLSIYFEKGSCYVAWLDLNRISSLVRLPITEFMYYSSMLTKFQNGKHKNSFMMSGQMINILEVCKICLYQG